MTSVAHVQVTNDCQELIHNIEWTVNEFMLMCLTLSQEEKCELRPHLSGLYLKKKVKKVNSFPSVLCFVFRMGQNV